MRYRLLALGLPLALAASLVARGGTAPVPASLHIATWNLEWLVDGGTARAARIACREALPAPMPCDVVRTLSRDSADIARLAAYARQLDADVIALQEVQNEAIAGRIFRGYRICTTAGPGVQQVGFALRAGLARDCGRPLTTLVVEGQGRAGLQLTLGTPGHDAIELLVVHLKSGCAREPLDSGTEACQLLTAQAQALGRWIAARHARRARFIVLGDLNRGGPPDVADRFWALLDPSAFLASASALPFASCTWGAPYREFIDHILVGHALAAALPAQAFSQLRYDSRDAARYQLSDHCPLRLSLNVRPGL